MGNRTSSSESSSLDEMMLKIDAVKDGKEIMGILGVLANDEGKNSASMIKNLSEIAEKDSSRYVRIIDMLLNNIEETIREDGERHTTQYANRILGVLRVLTQFIAVAFKTGKYEITKLLWSEGIAERVMLQMAKILFIEGFTIKRKDLNGGKGGEDGGEKFKGVNLSSADEVVELNNSTQCLEFIMTILTLKCDSDAESKVENGKWVEEFIKCSEQLKEEQGDLLINILKSIFTYSNPGWLLRSLTEHAFRIREHYLVLSINLALLLLYHVPDDETTPTYTDDRLKTVMSALSTSYEDANHLINGISHLICINFDTAYEQRLFSSMIMLTLYNLIFGNEVAFNAFLRSDNFFDIISWIISCVISMHDCEKHLDLFHLGMNVLFLMSQKKKFALMLATELDFKKYRNVVNGRFDLEFKCNWADVIVSTIVYIVTVPSKHIHLYNLTSLLIILSNIFCFTTNLSIMTGRRFIFLLKYFELPEVAICTPQSYTCFNLATAALRNLVAYQPHSNRDFIFFIYKSGSFIREIQSHDYNYYLNNISKPSEPIDLPNSSSSNVSPQPPSGKFIMPVAVFNACRCLSYITELITFLDSLQDDAISHIKPPIDDRTMYNFIQSCNFAGYITNPGPITMISYTHNPRLSDWIRLIFWNNFVTFMNIRFIGDNKQMLNMFPRLYTGDTFDNGVATTNSKQVSA